MIYRGLDSWLLPGVLSRTVAIDLGAEVMGRDARKTILEFSAAPIIYCDAVMFEMRQDIIHVHLLAKRFTDDGSEELHRQAILVLTPSTFAEALDDANKAAWGEIPITKEKRASGH